MIPTYYPNHNSHNIDVPRTKDMESCTRGKLYGIIFPNIHIYLCYLWPLQVDLSVKRHLDGQLNRLVGSDNLLVYVCNCQITYLSM